MAVSLELLFEVAQQLTPAITQEVKRLQAKGLTSNEVYEAITDAVEHSVNSILDGDEERKEGDNNER